MVLRPRFADQILRALLTRGIRIQLHRGEPSTGNGLFGTMFDIGPADATIQSGRIVLRRELYRQYTFVEGTATHYSIADRSSGDILVAGRLTRPLNFVDQRPVRYPAGLVVFELRGD